MVKLPLAKKRVRFITDCGLEGVFGYAFYIVYHLHSRTLTTKDFAPPPPPVGIL